MAYFKLEFGFGRSKKVRVRFLILRIRQMSRQYWRFLDGTS